jgi:hypothetical protein
MVANKISFEDLILGVDTPPERSARFIEICYQLSLASPASSVP